MHDKGVCFRTALGESLCGSLFLMHMSNLEKWRGQAPGGHWCQAPGIDRQLNNWLHDYLYNEYYGSFCSSKPELEQHHSG